MNIIRRILSILIIASICLSSLVTVWASPETSQKEIAETLYKLSVISGSNGNFNTDKQLQKCEALTFVVKILGKQPYVMENALYYSITGFPDVKPDAWYAPYVGYCVEQGIASGSTEGNFYPEDYISEKGFLLLVLRALGYSNQTDFSMDNIYSFAYNIGLLKDPAYAGRTQDNNKYLKGDAYEVIYNALSLKVKDNSTTVIQRMIDSGIVPRDAALEAGLIVDEVKTAIEEISVISSTRIIIKFNEVIYNIQDSDIQIYESMLHSPYLAPLSIESQSGTEIIVRTPIQKPGVHYTVEISNVFDLYGNPSEVLSSYFLGYEAPTVASDYFKISKVEAVSKNTIKVFFTHPINKNCEMPSYYELLEDGNTIVKGNWDSLAVKRLASSDNGVMLYFRDNDFSFADSRTYTIKVSGYLTSLYGTRLNEGQGESADFIAVDGENQELSLVDITPQTGKTIDVEFNKEIDDFYARQILNYTVVGPSGEVIPVSKAVLQGTGEKAGKVIRLTLQGNLDKNKNYELKIKYIADGVNQSAITDGSYPFSGKHVDRLSLSIRSLSAIDNATLLVKLSRQPDVNSALDTSNYLITGISHSGYSAVPVKVYYNPDEDPRAIKLYLPEGKFLVEEKSYRLRIYKTIKDEFGDSPISDLEASVFGVSEDMVKPDISEAKIISDDTIKLTFTGEIAAEEPNLLPANYSLEYREAGKTISKVPVFVGYIDPVTLILKFDLLDTSVNYTLKFNALKNYSGTGIRTMADGKNYIDVVVGK